MSVVIVCKNKTKFVENLVDALLQQKKTNSFAENLMQCSFAEMHGSFAEYISLLQRYRALLQRYRALLQRYRALLLDFSCNARLQSCTGLLRRHSFPFWSIGLFCGDIGLFCRISHAMLFCRAARVCCGDTALFRGNIGIFC